MILIQEDVYLFIIMEKGLVTCKKVKFLICRLVF